MTFSKPYFVSRHHDDVEHFSEMQNRKVVDEVSFIPFKQRINALIASGQVLNEHRRDLYDFMPTVDPLTGVSRDLTDDEFDSTSPNFVSVDPLEDPIDLQENLQSTIEVINDQLINASLSAEQVKSKMVKSVDLNQPVKTSDNT